MSEIFEALLHLAGGVGKVSNATMYESGFMTVDGKTAEGKKYSITLSIKEENEDD